MDSQTFILIDESVLTNGMRVLVDGIDLAQFERNPVMFYFHNDWNLPIGRWTNIRKEAGQVLADAEFDEEDDDKEVQRLIKKVKKGYVNMASAGLVDLTLSDDPELMVAGQKSYTIIRSRMREASIVPIGRNHNAIGFRLYDASGDEIDPQSPDASLKLSDFIVKPKIEKNMSKKYLQMLNLSDDASDQVIEAAVLKLQGDKEAAVQKAQQAEKELNDLKLADTQAKRSAFEQELDAAFKDGRLTEKPEGDKLTPVRENMLNLFDANPEGTRKMLNSIAKPVGIDKMELGDRDSKQLKELEAMTWDEMDKGGKVLLCRDSYPELYKEKFKARFGTEPKI